MEVAGEEVRRPHQLLLARASPLLERRPVNGVRHGDEQARGAHGGDPASANGSPCSGRRAYPGRQYDERTRHEDFSLDAELDETAGWDLDDSDAPTSPSTTTWESGYADEPDPERAATVGMQDLAERHALRRVAGLSTELEDISEVEYRQLRLERVVLVGVWTTRSVEDAENSMAELALLAETAGSTVLDAIYQRRNKPDPATYIGRGKVDGLKEMVQATGADTVICDGELAPSQLRNLEDRLKVKVVDRTALILDIFAQHAKSAEGQAQVELAQLNYMKQRLRGWGGNLSRQAGGRVGADGGGIGGRGPGETKIETDRRRINTKIAKLRRELTDMKGTRDTKRQERKRHEIPSVAIAGYTNAGKSSLLNRLTGAGVLVEDSLFATLDPTTRRTATADGRIYTMSDTVGFVRDLPHQLDRGVPLDAGGGRRLRPDPARRRRLAPRPRGPDRARCARCSPRSAPTRCPRSSSSTRPTWPTRW